MAPARRTGPTKTVPPLHMNLSHACLSLADTILHDLIASYTMYSLLRSRSQRLQSSLLLNPPARAERARRSGQRLAHAKRRITLLASTSPSTTPSSHLLLRRPSMSPSTLSLPTTPLVVLSLASSSRSPLLLVPSARSLALVLSQSMPPRLKLEAS